MFIKSILLIFFLASMPSFTAEQESRGFLSRKIYGLHLLAIDELDALHHRIALVKTGTKFFCGALILAPYFVLYYESSLPLIIPEQVRYALPPWSILTYSMTAYRGFEKTDELGRNIENEIKPFLVVLPKLIKLIEHIEKEVDVDNPNDFFQYMKDIWQHDKEVAEFFQNVKLEVLRKYPDNDEVDAIFIHGAKWRLLVILGLIKFFNHSDDKFTSLRQKSPTIYLPFLETGSMSYHGYSAFLRMLSEDAKDNLDIAQKKDVREYENEDGTKLLIKKLFAKME